MVGCPLSRQLNARPRLCHAATDRRSEESMSQYGKMGLVDPLEPINRTPSSLSFEDADLTAGNSNWTRGLQAMSEWIWSANLNPAAFPNNLGKFFLWIPGVFEQQLNYSTTLIFDESSFRNGVQISGMLAR